MSDYENMKMRERKRAARRKMRKKRRIKRALFLTVEILILCLLGVAAYVMVKYDKFQTVAFGEGDIVANKGVSWKGYKTVALFGGDSRTGDLEEGAQSDTIIVAAINSETKEVRMASVYRDTTVRHADGKIHKANYAYFTGGPKDAINMLNRNFDLDIQDYVTVDFKALADVVDLLGGIEVEITDDEAQEMNRHIDGTGAVAGKKANHMESGGTYTLDGVQAVTYARIRKNVGGDYKRTERQQLVIKKVVEKAKGTDLATVNKIINKVFPQISTSFTLPDLIGLAAGAFDYEIQDTTSFPMEAMNGRIEGLGAIIAPVGLTENVEELHAFLYPDETVAEVSDAVKEITAEIENLTGITREKLEDPDADINRSSYSIAQQEAKKSAEDSGKEEAGTEDSSSDAQKKE